jgi:hypothetical protein
MEMCRLHDANESGCEISTFDITVAKMMYEDPKSLIHGFCSNGIGLGEQGIREHSDKREDRGPKLPDGTYDQKTILYNREHAAHMVAYYLTSHPFTFTLVKLVPYYEDNEIEEQELQGDIVIDEIGPYTDEDYELSYVRFHIGKTCLALTLHSYGYKFEEHYYTWVVSHKYDDKEEYDFHDFMMEGESPKYDLRLIL